MVSTPLSKPFLIFSAVSGLAHFAFVVSPIFRLVSSDLTPPDCPPESRLYPFFLLLES